MQSSFTWGRKHGAGTAVAALLIGGSLLGMQLASAAGRSQPRAVTFPSYTAAAINDATGIPTAENINNSGMVVGYILADTGANKAFIRTDNTLAVLPGLGTGNTAAFTANSSGDVVGESRVTATGNVHAVVWHAADRQHPVDLNSALGVADGESHALGINDAGDIVGIIGARGGTGSAFFLSHNGTVTIIGPGEAWAVNNAATPQVAVMQSTGAEQQAGIWDALNGFRAAPILHSTGIRINDQGIMLGRASSVAAGGPQDIRFIWSAGQTTVHQLNFTAAGFFGGISNGASPTVVANDTNGPVLWKEDTVVSLSSLVANANQVDVDSATGINDSGKISATGFSGSWLFTPGSATHVDLQATITATQSQGTLPTNPVDFTVSIKNFGPDAATGVRVAPVINGVAAPPITVPGSIASGATFESIFHAKPSDFGVTGGTFIVTANVTSDGIEPDPDTTHRNSGSTTVTVSGGTTTLTLQSVTVAPNPVQVPKPASVVLTFSDNIPATGVNVTLQVTGVPVIGTYSQEFTGVHADAGKPKQATLTFDTSQLASAVAAPIQVHANAVYNGVTTNGPTVTINPAGPPPASAKAKTVMASKKAVVAGDPIHVTVTLDRKTATAMDGEVHFVVGILNTAYSVHFAANSSSASVDIPTTDFRTATTTVSARISASAGGASAKPSSVSVSILPIQLDAAKFTVVAPSAQVPGGKVSVILNFTGDLPDAGVDVVFNGLFVNNKTVHVTPTATIKSQATTELSTSEVTGTVSGTMTVSYGGKTVKSPKLTIKSATPPPPLALADASITPAAISNITAPTSIKVSVTFNQPLIKGQKVDVKLAITGPLPIPVNTKVSVVGVAGQATYVKTASDVPNFGQLLSAAPAGTYTVVASYGTGSKTIQFTIQ